MLFAKCLNDIKMKVIYAVIAIAVTLFCASSCISTATVSRTSGLSQQELMSIPKGSKEVIVHGSDRQAMYEKIISVYSNTDTELLRMIKNISIS